MSKTLSQRLQFAAVYPFAVLFVAFADWLTSDMLERPLPPS